MEEENIQQILPATRESNCHSLTYKLQVKCIHIPYVTLENEETWNKQDMYPVYPWALCNSREERQTDRSRSKVLPSPHRGWCSVGQEIEPHPEKQREKGTILEHIFN